VRGYEEKGFRRKKGLKRGVVLGEGSFTCKYEGEDFRRKKEGI